ncbi:MAG TPA: lysylphosphatidylglycerol synthase transmembrane domain-containing protein [Desulfobacteria bacterium]|nr:lysylphosphatidylglycerol synthase transmembrane domain-containing protein [Desulfobacteria bacterium]
MYIKSLYSKRLLTLYLKVGVTLGLLFVLVRRVNYREVEHILSGLKFGFLMSSALLVFLAIFLSAYKWQVLLAARGWKIPVYALTKIYFVGLFMNNFLPSSIGGDLMRIYQVGIRINSHTEAAASVILERGLATVGLAIPVFLAVLPNRELLGDLIYPILWFFVFGIVLIYLCINPAVLRPLNKGSWRWWQKSVCKLKEIHNIIQSYRSNPFQIVLVVIYSVAFQMSIVLINYFLLRAMGITGISLWQCTLIIPVISAVSMIPVSINGLGIREGAYVYLFSSLGMSAAQSVTLSGLFFIIVTAVSLLGGIIFVAEKDKEEYHIAGEHA